MRLTATLTLLALLLVTPCLAASDEGEVERESRLLEYVAWKGEPGGQIAEVVHIVEGTGASHWLLLTPERNRVLVSQEFEPGENRWTTRFSDEESGWWLEEVIDFPFSFDSLEDMDERFWAMVKEKDPLVSIVFRTADGFSIERTERTQAGPEDSEALARWLHQELTSEDDQDLPNLPLTSVEAAYFLESLQAGGFLDKGEPLYEVVAPLAVLTKLCQDCSEAPSYGTVSWTKGVVERQRTPVVEAVLDRFTSKDAKDIVNGIAAEAN